MTTRIADPKTELRFILQNAYYPYPDRQLASGPKLRWKDWQN